MNDDNWILVFIALLGIVMLCFSIFMMNYMGL